MVLMLGVACRWQVCAGQRIERRPHVAGSERRLIKRWNLAAGVPAQGEHRLLPRDGNAEIACDIFHSDCHIVIRSWLGISVGIERLLATRDHNTGRHASPTRAVAEAGPPPKMMKKKGLRQKARIAPRRPQMIIVYFNGIFLDLGCRS